MRSSAPYCPAGTILAEKSRSHNTIGVVAGIGNLLCSDDGVGIHAIRELEHEVNPGVQWLDLGTAILHSLSLLEGAERVLLIDAVRGGRPPGTIYQFDATKPGAADAPALSLHSVGLCDALQLLAPGQPQPQITVIGVEPQSLEYGMNLSPAVQTALPQVVRMVRAIVTGWGSPALDDVQTIRPFMFPSYDHHETHA